LAKPHQSNAEKDNWLRAGMLYVVVFPILIALLHLVIRLTGYVSGAQYLGVLPVYLYAFTYAISLHIQSVSLSKGHARLNALVLLLGGLLSLTSFLLLIKRGSLLSAISAQVVAGVALCLAWLIVARTKHIKFLAEKKIGELMSAVRQLSPYVGIAVAPALVGTASVILIRQIIIADLGSAAGGLWQGLFRISDAVMAMAQAAVGFVLMPAIFRSSQPKEMLRKFMGRYLLIVAAGSLLGWLLLYFFSPQIVEILYSEQFASLSDILWIQFFGDVLKIAAMPLVMYFIYRRSLFCSWGLELLFASSFVVFVWISVGVYAVKGAAIGYVMANAVLLISANLLFAKECK